MARSLIVGVAPTCVQTTGWTGPNGTQSIGMSAEAHGVTAAKQSGSKGSGIISALLIEWQNNIFEGNAKAENRH